jgi:hypothetical protein
MSIAAAESEITDWDNTTLALVLKRSYADGGYTVVSPQTGIARVIFESMNMPAIAHAAFKLNVGVAAAEMVDRLYERNKDPVLLTIKSSPENGYFIDYEGKFKKYFEGLNGGWEKWRLENPKAHGSTTVSLPVYDQQKGMVLIYMGTQAGSLMGAGHVILYKYENAELKESSKVQLWIS